MTDERVAVCAAGALFELLAGDQQAAEAELGHLDSEALAGVWEAADLLARMATELRQARQQ